jgi:hypothetical protein
MRAPDWFEAEAHRWRAQVVRAWLILAVLALSVVCVCCGGVALLMQGAGR